MLTQPVEKLQRTPLIGPNHGNNQIGRPSIEAFEAKRRPVGPLVTPAVISDGGKDRSGSFSLLDGE